MNSINGAIKNTNVEELDRDIQQIENDEQQQIEEENDQEGNDISNFGADYSDGNFYGDEIDWEDEN